MKKSSFILPMVSAYSFVEGINALFEGKYIHAIIMFAMFGTILYYNK